MPLLEANHLKKNYGPETILRDISFQVKGGESVAIVGPSGSGKTTLLSILGLLANPSGGELQLEGASINPLSEKAKSALRNRRIGFVFQSSQLIGTLSVLDNVLCPARFAQETDKRLPKAKELLKELGLGERLHHLPHQLSVGQRRRVALARALIMDPQLILADEPTNDLDPHRAQQVADQLFALPDRGVALVLVTHDHALASRADRVLELKEGRLEAR